MGHGDAAVDVEDQIGPLASRDLLLENSENQMEPLYHIPDSDSHSTGLRIFARYPEACADSTHTT